MKLLRAFVFLLPIFAADARGLKASKSKSHDGVTTTKNSKAPKSLKNGKKGKKTKMPKVDSPVPPPVIVAPPVDSPEPATGMNFNRVATFPICTQIDPNCNTDDESVAEIITATDDGMMIVYTDSEMESIGFVDIADPGNPMPAGVVKVPGEPTSVAVLGGYALAAVNTSEDYVNTSGELVAIDITSREILKSWDLGGQPDSIAVSPDGKYVVIAIENMRDEDLGDGAPPQMPAGYVVVVETASILDDWVPYIVDVTNLDGVLFPEDPEPEFVSISDDNLAVVTLQENNAIVIIDLPTKAVISSFSAGSVDLDNIDTEEEKIIDQSSSLTSVPREPDGVIFIDSEHFVVADEGDLNGGSRGFTIFNLDGDVVYSSGSEMDQIAASVGHYPDKRSGNKGVEPENVAYGVFEGVPMIFVNAERASLVFVYDVTDPTRPVFKQVLPTNVGPEGGKTIPQRNLLVVASEKDRRGTTRSTITIYHLAQGKAEYPTLVSMRDPETGIAIPFGSISGLSSDPTDSNLLYAVEDGFYRSNRFFTIDTSGYPAIITDATTFKDTNSIFANMEIPNGSPFTSDHLASMINDDGTVNIDPEGITTDGGEYLYIASEGIGSIGDDENPIESLNFIFKVDHDGVIHEVITLPDEINAVQSSYGLEGIAYHPSGIIVVCLQRAWEGFDGPIIALYNLDDAMWEGHVQYPLDDPQSQAGGWVGISEITWVDEGIFHVLERDNQGDLDAAVKKIYAIDLFATEGEGETISKVLGADLIDVAGSTGGLVIEKIEGMAWNKQGWWIINDNDGVDWNSGEIQLINVPIN